MKNQNQQQADDVYALWEQLKSKIKEEEEGEK